MWYVAGRGVVGRNPCAGLYWTVGASWEQRPSDCDACHVLQTPPHHTTCPFWPPITPPRRGVTWGSDRGGTDGACNPRLHGIVALAPP